MIIFNIEECTLYGCSSDSDTALVSTDITGQSVIMIVCILLIIFLAREERKRKRKHIAMKMDDNAEPLSDTVFKEKPWLLYVMTFGSILLIEIVDVTALVFLTQTNTKDNSTNTFQKQPRSFLTSLNFAEPEENYTRIDFPEHIPHKVPVLSLFNILFVYLFYPISRKDFSVCFGVAISIITLTATAVCNRLVDAQMNTETDGDTTQLIADILFHICLNFIGWYSRYVGDINNRRGFLDKRGCIETTFRLKHEKEKEEKLLQSIIPDHISSQLRDGIRKYLKAIMEGTQKIGFKDLYIEKFNDVTIVFADICNFTPLTVTLKPQELVETLNDLFGKFDDAAKERHCMRIKILGDCYYCVSGVPTPDPRHAHHAIEMGLDMINLIKEVRNEHSVPVNMRIGVHSGYILSGLIGLRKWQYDIWSKDVTIANHMESSGEPGKVHLTSETKKYLGDDYKCFPVSKMEDQVILESGYSTYLIHPHKRHISENESSDERVEREEKEEEEREREDKFDKASVKLGKSKSQDEDEPEPETETKPRTGRRVSISFAPGTVSVPERTNKRTFVGRSTRTSSIVSRSGSIWSEETERKRRKSVLMDSSLHSFKSMMQGTEKFMDSEIEELPIRIVDRWSLMSRFRKSKVEPTSMSDQWKRRVSKDINPVSLLFRDMEWNLEYLKEHDPLFKHYILASFIILNFMGIILIVTSYNTRPHVVLWVLYVLLFVVLVFLIPCTWISYIWDQIIDPQFDLDYIAQPDNAIIKFFYQASGKLNTKSLHRNIIFVFVSIMIVFSAIMDIVITPCKAESPRNYTYRCALSIMTIFMFLRINNIMKVLMTMFCLIFFALVISGSLGNPAVKVFFSMETFGFDHWLTDSEDPMEDNSNWSHFLYLLGIAILFIVSDRQKEYIHRLDYMWKRQLKKDQQEAETTKMVNKILLKNILPQHVADIYLNSERDWETIL
ncbi:adenylate cyclase type 2 [Eurytemora carolleeae]|uniref:adenylate cyclase type 2 n=1 Tax=Eurytemora carolleeae TaxID=1294199 RepID=UPI000C78B2B8|nr:adenylate cyclase type 2 [Eurytemora carolleeae]|eukprot:XP_023319662.1 adenylate cyclase type 2-like [Eurytemora affinis]